MDKGEDAIIQKLLAEKADPSLKDVLGNTSLHVAVQLKQERKPWLVKTRAPYTSPSLAPYRACSSQTVRAIIDHGADVNAVNNRGQTALWFACVDGQESFVKILLNAGADPSIADKYGDSCLQAAIHGQCSTEIIQEIHDHGAHVNAVNNDGATPLLLACSTAQGESVELLLILGADPNIADTDGDTSILSAIEGYCSVNTIQKLINYGAKVNATNNKGMTPLLKACSYRQMDVVKVLLEAGADPTIVDDVHYSSLHAAVDGQCSKDTLQALTDYGAHIDATRKDGTNALLRACKTGQSESVMFLLEAGADVNIAKPDGNTCLHEAVCGHCSKEILQKIIQQGVNVNDVNNHIQTSLILACYTKQSESAKYLLENGADPNVSDADGYTSLHAAVHGCCTNEALKEIIAHEGHLDAQNFDGETALWLACSYRQQDSVKILLGSGSNPNIACISGNTSLHAAINGRCSKNIVSLILDHGADVNVANKANETALTLACSNKKEGVINVLLNARADPNIADATGKTCLHNAVIHECSKDVLQNIIDHGADVNAVNMANKTALIIACVRKNEVAINVLLNASANPNIADDTYGDTCLHKAARQECSIEVLQAIVDHGADVNATNKAYETALTIAFGKKTEASIIMLINASVNPDSEDNAYRNTCLRQAVRQEYSKEVLQAIIDCGVDVNATNKKNRTALAIACLNRNEGAINVLLNAGTDLNIADNTYGETCLHTAVRQECSGEVLQTIIDHGADVNATNNANETALTIVCVHKNDDALNLLLYARANPNIGYVDGDTCLHIAVTQEWSKEIFQKIIDHGADVNATNKESRTVLAIACLKRNEGAIHVFLNAGADPKIADNIYGDTCLHKAVRHDCSVEVLRAIIDHGAVVNATNKKNRTALVIACLNKNEVAINVLLNDGADPNIADVDADTCLHIAVTQECSKEVLQAIIDHGVDVNAANKENETALTIACVYENEGAINALLNANVDPNIADDVYGDTCLHTTVIEECSIEVLQTIIDHGADVNAINKKNRTALAIACQNKSESTINILLDAGADPNITDADGDTCLHIAVTQECSKEVLQAIIDHGVDMNAVNKENETALTIACINENEDATNTLLNAKADPNIADDTYGDTCLHIAVMQECSIDLLWAIINGGADVNATNKKNRTALAIACLKKNSGALNVLLNAGADPNIADNAYGEACLHKAVRQNSSTKVLQAIIDHGAVVNAANKKNQTALIVACVHKNEDAINTLLNASADPNIPDGAYGDTCLHIAVMQECSTDLLQAIIDHGADVNATNKKNNTALAIACLKKTEGALNVLLNAGADPNIADSAYGDAFLHKAVRQKCSIEVLHAIIDHGANVNAANKKNQTPLTLACVHKNEDAINTLLNASADPNIPDDAYGDTCLHKAVRQECSIQVLQAIIDHGADVNATNKEYETALTIACVSKDEAAIIILLNASTKSNTANTDSDTCLHTAVRKECSQEVLQAIIGHGVDVNVTNKKNRTALAIACVNKNEAAIITLLNASASPNIADDTYGETCLHKVVEQECSKEVLQAIIHCSIDVNATNKEYETALSIACMNKNEAAVIILLNACANPNIADDTYGDTSLHKAARQECSIEVLQAIIDHGADVNATNKKNETVLTVAIINKNEGAINVLLNASADPNIADDAYGDSSLHKAVRQECSIEVLQAIIDCGANVNATNKETRTALAVACMVNNEGAVKVLLDARADPNITDDTYGDTCLHKALTGDCSIQVLQAIIDYGADVNATNKRNESALAIACFLKNKGAINVLLNAGADPNITDVNGNTCLSRAACGSCSKEVIQIIISHGADVNATNKSNTTALMEVCQNRNVNAINVLLNAGADADIVDDFDRKCLHYIFYSEEGSADLQSYIDHCADVNVTNAMKHSALVIEKLPLFAVSILLNSLTDPYIAEGDAVLYNPVHNHICKELLQTITDLGADLHVVKDESAVARLLACNQRLKESIDVLLRAGADTSTVDVFGDTCLHKILHREYLSLEYDHEALQTLLDHGAPVNTINKNLQTAYVLASNQVNIDAMFELLNAGADPSLPGTGDDTNLRHIDTGCSSNVTLQTIMLNTAWQYFDLPAMEITESLSFNLVSCSILHMMRHVICSKR